MQRPRSTIVVVHDATPCYRAGLVAVLDQAGFTARPSDSPTSASEHPRPDAALVTVAGTPDLARIAALLREDPELIVLALIERDDHAIYAQALAVGAHAALQRAADPKVIVHALDGALQRQAVLPLEVVRQMASSDPANATAIELSDEERAWLSDLMRGRTVRQVAYHSGYSERQIHRRLRELYRRLGATSRAEAVARAAALGIGDGRRSRSQVAARPVGAPLPGGATASG